MPKGNMGPSKRWRLSRDMFCHLDSGFETPNLSHRLEKQHSLGLTASGIPDPEHCGSPERQYGTQDGGGSWVWVCSANRHGAVKNQS